LRKGKKTLLLRQKLLKRGQSSPLFVYTHFFFMSLEDQIRSLVEPKLSEGQYIVDINVSARKGPKKVLVLVDGDQGINIDDCAEISRHLSGELDERGLIPDSYLLEVSTPGVDFPLKLKRQYQKNIGRSLKVKTKDTLVQGKLTSVDEERITLEEEVGSGKKKETRTHSVLFPDIEKATVLVSFK
jgi:ribosome maturation factor RimP